MAEPSTHINYSFEDIERYLSGSMSAAEMHDLEKAALQDPFLADAIEGFSEANLTIAQHHLNEINAALNKEKKESKVVTLNKKIQWLNAAVVIFIIAGIGVVSFFILNKPGVNIKREIAQEKLQKRSSDSTEHKPALTASAAPVAQQDSAMFIAKNGNIKKVISSKNINKEKNISDGNAYTEAAVTAMKAAPAEKDKDVNSPLSLSKVPVNNNDSLQQILQAKAVSANILPATFAGKVVDENNKPIPGTLIQSTDKKTAVFTDLNGNFSIQQKDTALNIIASTVGYASTTANLEAGNNNMIKLRGTNSNLNDVVVVGYGTRKQINTINAAEPVGGWQNFNNYVISSLNKDTTSQAIANPADQVEMEFLIDKLGNPYNITITKSLDDNHNAKAVELLKNGPRWTNTSKRKKVKVSISF